MSNGIIVLAIAGTFWLGYGFGPHLGQAGWPVAALFTVVLYGTCGLIVWLALRLRRKADFKRSELRQADERQRGETRKIMVGFLYIGLAQTAFIVLAVLLCLRLGLEDRLGPSIAFIVSLQFIPLGRIFHVQTHYFVGIVGCALSLVAFSPVFGVGGFMFLGGTMGVVLWLSAVYILRRADRIAAKAISEPWSV